MSISIPLRWWEGGEGGRGGDVEGGKGEGRECGKDGAEGRQKHKDTKKGSSDKMQLRNIFTDGGQRRARQKQSVLN